MARCKIFNDMNSVLPEHFTTGGPYLSGAATSLCCALLGFDSAGGLDYGRRFSSRLLVYFPPSKSTKETSPYIQLHPCNLTSQNPCYSYLYHNSVSSQPVLLGLQTISKIGVTLRSIDVSTRPHSILHSISIIPLLCRR